MQLSKSCFRPTNEFKYVKKLSSAAILVTMDAVSLLNNVENGETGVLKYIISLKKLQSAVNGIKLCRCFLGVIESSSYAKINQVLLFLRQSIISDYS